MTKFCLIILLITCFRSAALAEQWEGIVPGGATRSDVIRLFQKCADRTLPCEFNLRGDKIRIVFSGMVQDYFYECSKNLPADTVLLVEVTPAAPIRLKSVEQGHSFKKLGTLFEFSGYVDERAGLILKTDRNNVIQLNYVADASRRLRCHDYYSNPIKFVVVMTHCPPITVEGPSALITAGDVINFKADVEPDPKMTLVWTVSSGKIVSQAGRELALDTAGLGGNTLKVTLQALGSCSVENSLTLNIKP